MTGFVPQFGDEPDREHPLMNGLVAWYSMLEGGGTRLWDISGHNRYGTLSNMTAADWVAEPHGGRALDFDGVDDVVEVTAARNPLSGLSATTFSYWFNVATGYSAALNRHVSCGAEDDFESGPNWSGSTLAGVPSGHMGLYIRNTGGWYDLGAIPARGTWGHLAVTASSSGLAAYINGVQTFSNGTAWVNGVDGVLKLACRYSSGNLTSGLLADIRVFDRVLDAAEISTGLYADPWCVFRRPEPVQQEARSISSATTYPAAQMPLLSF